MSAGWRSALRPTRNPSSETGAARICSRPRPAIPHSFRLRKHTGSRDPLGASASQSAREPPVDASAGASEWRRPQRRKRLPLLPDDAPGRTWVRDDPPTNEALSGGSADARPRTPTGSKSGRQSARRWDHASPRRSLWARCLTHEDCSWRVALFARAREAEGAGIMVAGVRGHSPPPTGGRSSERPRVSILASCPPAVTVGRHSTPPADIDRESASSASRRPRPGQRSQMRTGR